VRNRKVTRRERTFASSISGETGGLSEREPPPLRGPLLWESRPEVRGATSCCRIIATQQARFQTPRFTKASSWCCGESKNQVKSCFVRKKKELKKSMLDE
jgi:hypothetical protein